MEENHPTINGSTQQEDDRVVEEEEEEEEEDYSGKDGYDEEEEDTTKLEEEVKEMANKVEEYRSTFPDQLKSSLSSFLHSQRPSFSLLDDASEPGPSSGPHIGAGSRTGNSSTELEADDGGEKNSDEIQLLRDKISSNISSIPRVLKRMNECISRIDKLVSSNETIHPVFKRKKS